MTTIQFQSPLNHGAQIHRTHVHNAHFSFRMDLIGCKIYALVNVGGVGSIRFGLRFLEEDFDARVRAMGWFFGWGFGSRRLTVCEMV